MSRRTNRSPKPTGPPAGTKARRGTRNADLSTNRRGDAIARRSDASDGGPSWVLTALIAIAALIVSIIAVTPIFSPRSMIAAIIGTEFQKIGSELNTEIIALNNGVQSRSPASILNEINRQRTQHQLSQSYFASKALVRRLADMEESGEAPGKELLDIAAHWTNLDDSNLLTRMFYAAVQDEQLRQSEANAASRFSLIQQILKTPPQPTKMTAYDLTFFEQFNRTIDTRVHRPDVATAFSAHYYYSPYFSNYADWFYVLPLLADRFGTLRDDLNAAGDSSAAAQCDRWIATLCVGVLANERESGIQCLAADTLARELGPTHPAIAESMNKLLADHTRNHPSVGTDRCAQFLSQPPLVMAEYEPAVERLAFFVCLGVLAAAAAMTFLLAIASLALPASRQSASTNASPIWQRALLTVLIILVVPIILSVSVSNIYSASPTYQTPDHGLALLHAFVLLMSALIVLYATAHPGRNWATRIRQGWPALILFLLAAVFIALPARTTVPFLRNVNYTWPGMLWSFGLSIVLIIAAMIAARLPANRLARCAAAAWLIYAVVALVVMQLHLSADRAYQKAVVAAYHDPLSARLGADWQKRYLDPVRNAFEPPLK